jgi:integrase
MEIGGFTSEGMATKSGLGRNPALRAFAQAYADALAAIEHGDGGGKPEAVKGASAGTLGWRAACYFASPDFKRLDRKSQATRRLVIEACLREPRRPGALELMRDCPISGLSTAHIKMLRDRRAAQPGAANNRRKYLSSVFGWAVENNLMRLNPAREVRKIKYVTSGFHTWTRAEVLHFEDHHSIGTKPRLALALLLYLGVRRGDVVTLGRQHVRDNWLCFVPRETRYRRERMSERLILPPLADIIGRSPTGDMTFLL